MNTAETSIPEIERLQKPALVVGLAALIVCGLLGIHNPTQFFRSYLVAFVFWIGLPLGCIAILMLHYLVGGTWGFPLRRLLESGTRTFVLMAVLVLPILFRLRMLYSWADPHSAITDPFKHFYLSVPFFIVRTVIYFTAWLLLAHFLNKWSRLQDETGDPALTPRLQLLSGPGILIFGLTVTYMSLDWVMSLQPAWFSTIFGMIFMVTEALAAMAFLTIAIILLSTQKPLADMISKRLLGDYANLLLTFTMLWAYLSFSQFLIIWAGNLRDETPWYMSRARGPWAWVALALIVFHFAVPFLLLISRFVTRQARLLIWVAGLLLVMSLIDIYWLSVPAFEPGGPGFHITDWLAVLGIGGLWLWRFTTQLKGKSWLPLNDPRLKVILQEKARA